MTTMSNGTKTIQISLANTNNEKEIMTILKLPKVVCNNKEDAEYIQKEVNLFTYNLCRKVVEGVKNEN